MTYRVSLRRLAGEDLREAREWDEAARVGLGEEYLLAVTESLMQLEETPQRFPVYHKDFRRALVNRFPYRVFFRIDGDDVIVFRILHGAREHRSLLH